MPLVYHVIIIIIIIINNTILGTCPLSSSSSSYSSKGAITRPSTQDRPPPKIAILIELVPYEPFTVNPCPIFKLAPA